MQRAVRHDGRQPVTVVDLPVLAQPARAAGQQLGVCRIDDIVAAAQATGKVVMVDECRKTGGVAEGVFTAIVEACPEVKMARVTGDDTYIPLGDAANLVLVQEPDIELAIRAMVERA